MKKVIAVVVICMMFVSPAFGFEQKLSQGGMSTTEKAGAATGGVVGFGASAATILSIGGSMSGAAIMHTAAVIGAAVGGGAVAGIVVVAGGTVLVTGACAYGGYKLISWYNN